jgi:hypothetical protein
MATFSKLSVNAAFTIPRLVMLLAHANNQSGNGWSKPPCLNPQIWCHLGFKIPARSTFTYRLFFTI